MSDRRQLKKQTRSLLSGLGSTADEVAESLEADGVRGVPKNNRGCAVAVYLSALIGSDPRVRSVKVGHCSLFIEMTSVERGRPAGRLQVQLPKAVRHFVAAFDAQVYPDVVRQPPSQPMVVPTTSCIDIPASLSAPH
jgi:hypothetical protein